jgi:hypothetical protein
MFGDNMKKLLVIFMIGMLILSGCSKDKPKLSAGLSEASPEKTAAWSVQQNIRTEGNGNSYRVVSGAFIGQDSALELVAGGDGTLEYFCDYKASPQAGVNFRLQFLSTQGAGRVLISALDAENNVVAASGWVYTGNVPGSDSRIKWTDVRYNANYVGDWIASKDDVAKLLAAKFTANELRNVATYRISVFVGQGQHALITSLNFIQNPTRAIRVIPPANLADATVADTIAVYADVENITTEPVSRVEIGLIEPWGYGIVTLANRVQLIDLQPGEKKRLEWKVRAQRPSGVNLGRPWTIGFSVGGMPVTETVSLRITDPRPGKIFYVMTEDLEPIDSAGYPVAWGNRDGWLEPEELTTQMVQKVEKIDGIADQYGAKWTHYIAWPVIRAAEWAATMSSSGKWPKAIEAIKTSVITQAAHGHEYGIHMHSDYDPYLPGNVLSYNAATDGLWANHLRHGWAHSIGLEGDFGNYASRTGILYAYQRSLDSLLASSPQGQQLTARMGSFDFGSGKSDEAASIRAFRKVGLWAGSDAEGNRGGITAGDFGHEIYFSKQDDIVTAAIDLESIGIVEFRPTPKQFINYDGQSAAVMNQKVDTGIASFSADGKVAPGVHAIVGFTHVMFMMGEGGWQSTDGGQFAVLDAHLRYLKERYVDQGLLKFATANELVREYLDYYSPQPVALYGARSDTGWGSSEYPIIILGRDIPIDNDHPHAVTVKYPLYLRDSAYRVEVLKNGTKIYGTWGLPTPTNDIVFTVNDSTARYTLKVYHNNYIAGSVKILRNLETKLKI